MDFPDWLLHPLFLGFPIYIAHRLKTEDTFQDHGNLIFIAIAIGLIFSAPLLWLQDFIISKDIFVAPLYLTDSTILIINLTATLSLGMVIGFLYYVSSFNIEDKISKRFNHINNSLEEDAVFAIQSHLKVVTDSKEGSEGSLMVHMIELVSGKIYIGVLTHIDLKDEGGYLKLLPIKSGFRKEGHVSFKTDYRAKEIVEQDILPPEILLPKKDVVTFREFNPDLDNLFNSQDQTAIKLT